MRLVTSGASASGVTSRGVTPVPPVAMTTSIPGSAIHGGELGADLELAVDHDRARGDPVADLGHPIGDVAAGGVGLERARIGDGQDGDVDRDELALHALGSVAYREDLNESFNATR